MTDKTLFILYLETGGLVRCECTSVRIGQLEVIEILEQAEADRKEENVKCDKQTAAHRGQAVSAREAFSLAQIELPLYTLCIICLK